MNCPKCNNPLLPNARFCPICGYSTATVAASTPTPEAPASQGQRQPDYGQPSTPGPNSQPPQFTPPQQQPQPQFTPQQQPQQQGWSDRSPQPQFTPQQQPQQQGWPDRPPQSQSTPQQQPQQQGWPDRPPQSQQPQQFTPQPQFPQQQGPQAAATNTPGATSKPSPGKKRLGVYLLRVAITLAVVVVLLIGSWIFALRPWLHSMASDQMGKVLDSTLDSINPITTLLIPANIPLPVPEALIARALVTPTSSWFTIQDMQLSITSANIRFTFQVQVGSFSFICGVTTIPEAVNGLLDVKSISVDGPIGIVMTADEMKAQINAYLTQVHDRINRPFKALALEEGFMLITFG